MTILSGQAICARTLMLSAQMLVLLTVAAPARAQISFVADLGSNETTGVSTTSLSITTTASAPAGASIIVVAVDDLPAIGVTPTSVTCSDSAGHSYVTDVLLGGGGGGPQTGPASICSTHRIAGALPSLSTITVTWSGGSNPQNQRVRAFAVTGLASTPLDRTASSAGHSTSPSSGATAVTSQADELLVGAIADYNSSTSVAAFSPGSGYTALAGVGTANGPSLFAEYQIVAATGTYAATGTFAVNDAWRAVLATYKAAPSADLAVTKSGPATIIAGNNITYAVTVANNGPFDAQSVTLSDTLPVGTTFVSEAQNTGPAFTCTNPAVGGTGSVSCAITTLASSASATFSLVFNVNANVAAGSTISNTASASSSTSDPTPGNNSQSASATVNQMTTTGVTSSVNPSDFGQSVTFTATVISNGGTPTGTVQFKDNGTNLGGLQTLNPSGVATFATSALTVGTHTITADYGGGTNFLASSGTLLNGQVVRAQPSLTINDVSLTEGDSGTKNFIFTVTQSAASNLEVKVDFATANGTATIADSDYQSNSGTLTFNPGDLTKTITVLVNGDQKFEPDETFFVNLTNPINATIGDNQGLGTITNDDAVGGIIRFASATYNTTESSGSTTVTVERVGDTTQAVTVDYATPDDSAATTVVPCATINGLASPRCDFTAALGTLKFAAGEGSKTFTVLISQDNFVEGPESLTLTLSNPTGGAVFGVPTTATLTITDDATEPAANPIDDANNFVQQHYHDFLNREPDAGGLGFWTSQITSCGMNAQCIESKRVNVSAAFYLSIEFQNTGYLVERLYKASYADATGTSTIGGAHQLTIPIVKFSEFLPDTQTIGQGLVVGQTGWETVLENNKQTFVAEFVQRSRFTTAYANTLTPAQFVDMLFANAGVVPTSTERQAAIDEFGGAATSANAAARGRALRRVAENSTLAQQEFNRAFVLMEYFGYLRRNPNAAPDSDFSGYDFWLTKLNNFTQPGDDVLVRIQKAEMVKAFINSSEYRQRFGP